MNLDLGFRLNIDKVNHRNFVEGGCHCNLCAKHHGQAFQTVPFHYFEGTSKTNQRTEVLLYQLSLKSTY